MLFKTLKRKIFHLFNEQEQDKDSLNKKKSEELQYKKDTVEYHNTLIYESPWIAPGEGPPSG